MAQPVTPQDHIVASVARITAQQDAMRQLARELAEQRDQAHAVAAPAIPTEGK